MSHPPFYDRIDPIVLHDPLSDLLGSFETGRIVFTYADCVRIAGHSCPTVAGAWLMTQQALALLYPDTPPVRGEIAVHFKMPAAEGTTGVVATLFGAITGASDEKGFKGIGGRFGRAGLLRFACEQEAPVRFVRTDTGDAVSLWYDPSAVPPEAQLGELMQQLQQGSATPEARQLFGTLWQQRVERIFSGENRAALLRAELEPA